MSEVQISPNQSVMEKGGFAETRFKMSMTCKQCALYPCEIGDAGKEGVKDRVQVKRDKRDQPGPGITETSASIMANIKSALVNYDQSHGPSASTTFVRGLVESHSASENQ